MKLSKEDIKSYELSLPKEERFAFVEELLDVTTTASIEKTKLSHREMLNNNKERAHIVSILNM